MEAGRAGGTGQKQGDTSLRECCVLSTGEEQEKRDGHIRYTGNGSVTCQRSLNSSGVENHWCVIWMVKKGCTWERARAEKPVVKDVAVYQWLKGRWNWGCPSGWTMFIKETALISSWRGGSNWGPSKYLPV